MLLLANVLNINKVFTKVVKSFKDYLDSLGIVGRINVFDFYWWFGCVGFVNSRKGIKVMKGNVTASESKYCSK
jgi:hypothetical protein